MSGDTGLDGGEYQSHDRSYLGIDPVAYYGTLMRAEAGNLPCVLHYPGQGRIYTHATISPLGQVGGNMDQTGEYLVVL